MDLSVKRPTWVAAEPTSARATQGTFPMESSVIPVLSSAFAWRDWTTLAVVDLRAARLGSRCRWLGRRRQRRRQASVATLTVHGGGVDFGLSRGLASGEAPHAGKGDNLGAGGRNGGSGVGGLQRGWIWQQHERPLQGQLRQSRVAPAASPTLGVGAQGLV
jgi:hypothetical protein